MKILITGGAGYIASSVIDLALNKGYEVCAFDNNHKSTCDLLIPFISNPKFSFISGDITNVEDIKSVWDGVDYCLHAAAIVGAPACKKNITLSEIVNVYGTENVVRYKPDNVKLVYCNTGSIYKGGNGVCDEKSEVKPNSHYAKTKFKAEGIALDNSIKNVISHRYATAAGLSKTNIRVNLLSNDLTWQGVTNKSVVIFEGSFMRTFIHCRDIASSIVFTFENFDRMLDKQKIYNVGNNDLNFTKLQLAELIKEKTRCFITTSEIEKDPDQRDYGYSSEAIYSFGWRPQINMDQTIDELIKTVPILTPWQKYN